MIRQWVLFLECKQWEKNNKKLDFLPGKLHGWCKFVKDNTFKNAVMNELQTYSWVNVLTIMKAAILRDDCYIYILIFILDNWYLYIIICTHNIYISWSLFPNLEIWKCWNIKLWTVCFHMFCSWFCFRV